MKNNNLLASVALFSELYNSDKFSSIPDILGEFIKGAVVFETNLNLNSTEIRELLRRTYGFDIPESVIRTTLKNSLKDIVSKGSDNYHFEISVVEDDKNFKSNVELINGKQDNILSELYKFIEIKKNTLLTEPEKANVFKNFSHFLMDNSYSDKYSELIGAFVVSKEADLTFKEELGAIKEGLILYQGINYSADINQLGSWKDELTIYLSTEHLFNCLGYNGLLYMEIFNDFLKLVNEINRSQINKNAKKLIELKYFQETYDEIDHFFSSAESIKKGFKRLDSSKNAMVHILKGCDDVSDIKKKQVIFFLELKRKGITMQDYSFDIEKSQYNVVDGSLIENLKKISEEKQKPFDEEYCVTCLRIFTKVNTFRRGVNNGPFEKIKHIYITENNFAKYLGHNNKVKFGERDIAFAKDIDYVISKFWFKLRKGFNDKAALPITFDFVTKAKIIIASQINNAISTKYDLLQKKFKKGELTEELANELFYAYKEKPNTPELVTPENIDDSLLFLTNENFIEDFLREKTRKETEHKKILQEKELLEKELHIYKQKELEIERLRKEQEDEDDYKRQQAKIDKDSLDYAQSQWDITKTRNYSDCKYLLFVFLLTSLPVFIGLILKLYSPLNQWLKTIGNYQLLIWLVLSAIFIFELIGRSYIFDEDKVKNGWNFLKIVMSLKYGVYKSNKIKELTSEYKQNPAVNTGYS